MEPDESLVFELGQRAAGLGGQSLLWDHYPPWQHPRTENGAVRTTAAALPTIHGLPDQECSLRRLELPRTPKPLPEEILRGRWHHGVLHVLEDYQPGRGWPVDAVGHDSQPL